MSMNRLGYALAALPFIAGVALAQPANQNDSKIVAKQPTQLSDQQMDKITAGWDDQEYIASNTSQVWVSVYERRTAVVATPGVASFGLGNNINCATSSPCYLGFNNPAFSVASAFYKP